MNTNLPDLEYWIVNLVSTCQFIINSELVEKVWAGKNYSISSIHNFDELYVQILDDMAFESAIVDFEALRENIDAQTPFRNFLTSLKRVNSVIEAHDIAEEPNRIFQLEEWKLFREASQMILSLQLVSPYLSAKKVDSVMSWINREWNDSQANKI